MILDSSAIVAVLLRQPGHERILERLAGDGPRAVGAPTFAETGIVMLAKAGITGLTLASRFLQASETTVLPFGEEESRVAIDAYLRFGKGRHEAGLNFGDCMTYATAALARQPLLCLGDDFARTDLDLVG